MFGTGLGKTLQEGTMVVWAWLLACGVETPEPVAEADAQAVQQTVTVQRSK